MLGSEHPARAARGYRKPRLAAGRKRLADCKFPGRPRKALPWGLLVDRPDGAVKYRDMQPSLSAQPGISHDPDTRCSKASSRSVHDLSEERLNVRPIQVWTRAVWRHVPPTGRSAPRSRGLLPEFFFERNRIRDERVPTKTEERDIFITGVFPSPKTQDGLIVKWSA